SLLHYISDLSSDFDDFGKTKFGKSVLSYIYKVCLHYEKIFSCAESYTSSHEEVAGYAKAFNDDAAFAFAVCKAISEEKSFSAIRDMFLSHSFTKLGAKARGYTLPAEVEFYIEARKDFKKELEKLAENIFVFSCDAEKKGAEFLRSALSDLYSFMKCYRRRLDAEKRRRHAISFSDIEHKALSLVFDKSTGAPTPLALSMRDDFDEIFIDEYQDTNEVQDKIFYSLSRGNNRFVVGDIKQCIYAFRNADPSIFASLTERSGKYSAENDDAEQKIFLSQNFRSTDEILGFANAVFALQMERGNVMPYGEDERLYGTGKHGDKVVVAVCAKDKEKEDSTEPEAEYVARKAYELLRSGKKLDGTPIRPSDIVIILRSVKNRAKIFRDALEKYGVPCEDLATERFFESPEVLLVISLLNVIDNPERDIYLAATLKSPLYGVTLSELIYIRRYYKDGTLFDALRRFTEDKKFAKGRRFLADYEKYREAARTKPCDELIWQIYMEKEILSL
ncbi:MAG: UvrD-helicase domain-containing protein, partial [Eubacteriales bacterium]